ncbi:MAG: hypothetical protein J5885_05655 [Clostridia bacterium]|nr:hypothetical protein [Clostridia bacterium]
MNLKAHRKILPAMLILLLSLALVSSATYAWFSMNTTVKGTGMTVTSTAPTNMLISVNPSDPSAWENGVTANTAVSGGFSPASTVDGVTFFALAATDGIDVDGSIVDAGNRGEVQLAQVNRVADSNTYYAEVALYIKAGEQTSLSSDLTMYLNRMTVDTASLTDIANCVRVSITSAGRNTGVVTFNADGTVQDGESNILSETAAIIYKYDTVTGVSPISAVNGEGTPTLAADTARVPGDTTTCFTVDYTGAQYTTVIVRIWLEGQHEACVNEISGESITVGLEWEASNYSA